MNRDSKLMLHGYLGSLFSHLFDTLLAMILVMNHYIAS